MSKHVSSVLSGIAIALLLWVGSTVQAMSVTVATIEQRLNDDVVNVKQQAALDQLDKRMTSLETKK